MIMPTTALTNYSTLDTMKMFMRLEPGCRSGWMSAPPAVHMIKLTEAREITPYKWVHPDR
jgi:hypothetical protein